MQQGLTTKVALWAAWSHSQKAVSLAIHDRPNPMWVSCSWCVWAISKPGDVQATIEG